MKSRSPILALASLTVAAAAVPAHATLINVQFTGGAYNGTSAATQTGAGPAGTGAANDYWNPIVDNGSNSAFPITLSDSTGTATSMTLSAPTQNSNAGYDAGPSGTHFNGTAFQNLFSATLALQAQGVSSASSITVNNVPAGTYNVFLYSEPNQPERSGDFSVNSGPTLTIYASNSLSIATQSTSYTAPGGSAPAYTNYAEFTTTVSAGGSITITGVNAGINPETDTELDINGFTIQSASATPEPASLGILALGAVGLLSRRRRRVV